MLKEKNTSVVRSFYSFGYAWKGIKLAFVTQVNFKIQLVIASVALIAALILKFSTIEWSILILTITAVLVTELINTSIEFITDHLFPGYHETAGKIKDVSAAAVLISAVAAVIVGLLLFLPKIL